MSSERLHLVLHATERARAEAEKVRAWLAARGIRTILEPNPPAPSRRKKASWEARPSAVAALLDDAGPAWWEQHLRGYVGVRRVIALLGQSAEEPAEPLDESFWSHGRPLDMRGPEPPRRELDRLVFLISGRALPANEKDAYRDRDLRPELPLPSLEEHYRGGEGPGNLPREVHQVAASEKSLTVIAPRWPRAADGVGKTRLAVEFAYRYWWCYTLVIFVRALHTSAVVEVNRPLRDGGWDAFEPMELLGYLRLDGVRGRHLVHEIEKLVRFLKDRPGWLMIVDGVDHEDAVEGILRLAGESAPYGHLVVTSRLYQWSSQAEIVRVSPLSAAAARKLLFDEVGGSCKVPRDEADELMAELRGIPLAVRLAGRALLLGERVVDVYRGDASRRRERRNRPVEVAVEDSLAVLGELDRTVLRNLEMFSFMAPNAPLPADVFDEPMDLCNALALTDPQGGKLVLSPVVRDVVRTRIPAAAGGERVGEALDLLERSTVRQPMGWVALRPHITAAVTAARELAVHHPTTLLMSRLAFSLLQRGLVGEAEDMVLEALAMDLEDVEEVTGEWEDSLDQQLEAVNERLARGEENTSGNADLLLGGVDPRPANEVLGRDGRFFQRTLGLIDDVRREFAAMPEVGDGVPEERREALREAREGKLLSLMARQSPGERRPRSDARLRGFQAHLKTYSRYEVWRDAQPPSRLESLIGRSREDVFWQAVDAGPDRGRRIVIHLAHLALVLAARRRHDDADEVRRLVVQIGQARRQPFDEEEQHQRALRSEHPPVATLMIHELVKHFLTTAQAGAEQLRSQQDLMEALLRDAFAVEDEARGLDEAVLQGGDFGKGPAADNHYRMAVHELSLGVLRLVQLRPAEARKILGDCLARLAVVRWRSRCNVLRDDEQAIDLLRTAYVQGRPDETLEGLIRAFLGGGDRGELIEEISEHLLVRHDRRGGHANEPGPYVTRVPAAEPYPPFKV